MNQGISHAYDLFPVKGLDCFCIHFCESFKRFICVFWGREVELLAAMFGDAYAHIAKLLNKLLTS